MKELCRTATKETGYYWEQTVYDSKKKRKWVLLTAHCVWQQQKKIGITESTLYDSNKRTWTLLRAHHVW